MPQTSAPQWEHKSFQLELPCETTDRDAYDAGKQHLEKDLTPHTDYTCNGCEPHPTMSAMRIFTYSYKVRAGS